MGTKKPARMPVYFLAGAEGFEPPMPGPKPGALPLGHAPTNLYIKITHQMMNNRQLLNPWNLIFQMIQETYIH